MKGLSMAKRKNWKKVNSDFLLKLDPFYNKKINDCEEFIPTESTFFKQLYTEPSAINNSNQIDENIRNKIQNRTKNLVLCIKGYAGCGKSVYVQKLMYDFYPKNNNFKNNTYNLKASSIHKLEIGAGTSTNDIKSRYIDDLSTIIAEGIISNIGIYDKFCEIVISNDDAIRHIDNALDISDNFTKLDSIRNCLNKELDVLRDAVRIELKNFDIPILFAIDCLWRITIHAYEMETGIKVFKNSVFFICFDNLDAIDDIDACRDFLKKMCEFKINLDECLYILNKNHKEYDIKTFTFFITCRNVTWGRLHLSEYVEDDDGGDISTHLCDYDISAFYEYVDIVKSRIDYYSKKANNNPQAIQILNDMSLIEELNQMLFVKERFKPLFNYNYRKCIDVICEILPLYRRYLKETVLLVENALDSSSDGVYSGSSSVFFRMVFEYFKKHNLFETTKMDLVDLSAPHYEKTENKKLLTSQARIILMYLYNQSKRPNGGATRLNQIFDYFAPIYPLNDVCETIYNLFMRNSAWRRPINFSSRPLKDHHEREDIDEQLNSYLTNKSNGSIDNFTKFEICKAGKEYIEFIITHFEFYACRCSDEDLFLPPLFSTDSLHFIEESKKYQFELTCEIVLKAVENCCEKLRVFNESVMNAKNLTLEKYLPEPINVRTTRSKKPQLHEERVIFCHIYHLEAYRYYLINTIFKNENLEMRSEINKRMTDIIKQYLELHKKYIKSKEQNNIVEILGMKIQIIENSKYLDFQTKISKI